MMRVYKSFTVFLCALPARSGGMYLISVFYVLKGISFREAET